MIQVFADDARAYDSRLESYDLIGLKITSGVNIGGTAEIVMPIGHPAYHQYISHKTIVTIYRDGDLRFRGRALYPSDTFYGQRTITCEGELCLLKDGISRPYVHQGTPANVFTAVIQEYNNQVEEFKQFRVGTITVGDDTQLTGTITANSRLRIRNGPGVDYDVVGYVSTGTKVTILEVATAADGDWGRISQGWISLDLVFLDTDSNSYIRLESDKAETILDTVNKLLERCGGYIVFTTAEDGARVINWYSALDNKSNQSIEFGENLLDFSSTGSNTDDLATGLIPYGAKDESTGKRLTIESVNDGLDYIIAEDARVIHGTIMASNTWDDITDAATLLSEAKAYLAARQAAITSLTLSAVDLSYFDKSLASFVVGDLIRVVSVPHGVDEDFQLTKMTENLLNPTKSSIVLGKDVDSLTRAYAH